MVSCQNLVSESNSASWGGAPLPCLELLRWEMGATSQELVGTNIFWHGVTSEGRSVFWLISFRQMTLKDHDLVSATGTSNSGGLVGFVTHHQTQHMIVSEQRPPSGEGTSRGGGGSSRDHVQQRRNTSSAAPRACPPQPQR